MKNTSNVSQWLLLNNLTMKTDKSEIVGLGATTDIPNGLNSFRTVHANILAYILIPVYN